MTAQIKCMPHIGNESNWAKQEVKFSYLREADIIWAKRVWRTISKQDVISIPLFIKCKTDTTSKNLFDVIKDGLLEGKIIAYGNPFFDDNFSYPLKKEEVELRLRNENKIFYASTNDTSQVYDYLRSEEVSRYWIMEDWFFDKQRSVMEVRIMAICPLIEKIDPLTGELRAYEPLFWVNFNQCRPLLANNFTTSWDGLSITKFTFDDLLVKRMYTGFIHKVSNVNNISLYELFEGECFENAALEIKYDLIDIECRFWND